MVGFADALPQKRVTVFFRIILMIPHAFVLWILGIVAEVIAIIGWFAALFTGRMPRNLRQSQVFALRYGAQLYAYGYLLTDRYPFASPAPPAAAEQPAPTAEPALQG